MNIPEPSTWAMMLVGFTGLAWVGHRASRTSVAKSKLRDKTKRKAAMAFGMPLTFTQTSSTIVGE